MKTCCQSVPEIKCATVAINERIAPITFEGGVLAIDSPLDTGEPVTISGAEISVEDGHLNIPTRTLINGVPLISDAFVGDATPIPSNTVINGFKATTEQYFYFFTTSSSSFLLNSFNGYVINGQQSTTSTPTIDLRGFPFIAPENCVLTSLRVSYILTPGFFGVPGDGRISLDVVDTNLNPFFTGVSYDIIAPTASSNTTFYKEFEYMVLKGDSVGLFVSGTAQFGGGILVYATLGYSILPTSLISMIPLDQHMQLKTIKKTKTTYNRFPFNSIMNSGRNQPIQFHDQLNMFNTKTPSNFYGRKLTAEDNLHRSPPTTDAFNVLVLSSNFTPHAAAHQDAVAFLLSGQKKKGWYINMAHHDQNVRALAEQHEWQGITSHQEEDFLNMIGAPNNLDYLSFDLDSTAALSHILSIFTFNFATTRHNAATDTMQSFGYVKLFTGVVIDANTQEDWYVEPHVLPDEIIAKTQNHPEDTHWTECLTLLSCIL